MQRYTVVKTKGSLALHTKRLKRAMRRYSHGRFCNSINIQTGRNTHWTVLEWKPKKYKNQKWPAGF